MKSNIWVRSITQSSAGVAGTISDRHLAKRRCGRRQDGDQQPGITLLARMLSTTSVRVDAVDERFGTGGFDSGESVGYATRPTAP